MQNLKITIIQPDIKWETKIDNLHNYEKNIKLITSNPDVIILPEMFTTGFTMNTQLAETMAGHSVEWMQRISKESNANIMGSLIIEEDSKIFNRFLSVKDNIIEFYDKRHLFAFAGEDKHFTSGNTKKIVNINGWRILLQICYDLRFPVFSININDYDVIIYVANWPSKRSQHWKALLQARAIENQAYVIGVNRVGIDGLKTEYSGDSSVYDPLGNLVYQHSNSPNIADVILDYSNLESVRTTFKFLDDADCFYLK